MEENDYMITCSRCGAEMKHSARYCMKCGNLNPDHPDNKSMEKYMNTTQEYFVGSGKSIAGEKTSGGIIKSVANNTGSSRICLIVNLVIYLFIILLCLLLSFIGISDIKDIIYTGLPIEILTISFSFIYIFANERMFMKMNNRWWAALVPIYNYFVMSDAVFGNKMLGLLILIPGVNFVYILVLYYKLGQKFGKSGLFTALFSIIMIPIIGYGSSLFENKSFVDYSEEGATEKNYKDGQNFLTVCVLLMFISFACLIYVNYDKVQSTATFLNNWYYMKASDKVMEATKEAVNDKSFTCDDYDYTGADGTYYFIFDDVGDELGLPLQFYFDPISANVRMDIINGKKTYYISITDGSKGYGMTKFSDVDDSKIKKFDTLDDIPEIYPTCYLD